MKFGARQYFHKHVLRILSTGGCLFWGGLLPGHVCSWGGSALGECLLPGGLLWGAGWVPGPGGGGYLGDPPMATAVYGMHPTGMHSCLKYGQFGQ